MNATLPPRQSKTGPPPEPPLLPQIPSPAEAASARTAAVSAARTETVCRVLLGGGILLYVIVFTRFTFSLFDRCGYFAFDLGIFDQAAYLISRGETPFVTVRGLHLLADHFSVLLYLLAPIYRLFPHPKTLLFLQTLALALGALPVYALARQHRLAAPIALLFAVVYLCYPAMQWSNTYEFHLDPFATPLLLGAFWALFARRWKLYAVFVLLALTVKENVGVTVLLLGLWTLWQGRRQNDPATTRAGWLTVLGGISGTVIAFLTIRHFNHGEASAYWWLYQHWGGSPTQIAVNLLTRPGDVVRLLTAHLPYFGKLLGPLLLLPLLLAPDVLLIAAAALLTNLLSSRPFMHDIEEYHTALITPVLFAAAIVGAARVYYRLPEMLRRLLLVNLAIWGIGGMLVWGPFARDLSTLYSRYTPVQGQRLRTILRTIPPDATVAATMAAGPHLSKRRTLYTLPNPFVTAAWGSTLQASRDIEIVYSVELPSDAALSAAVSAASVEWVVLTSPLQANPFPLSETHFHHLAVLLLSNKSYGIASINSEAILLRRGADHAAGLRKLAKQTRIAGAIETLWWRWLAQQSNTQKENNP